MSGGEAAALPAGSSVWSCPLPHCGWTHAQPPPDAASPGPVAGGESLEDSIARASLAILSEWYGEAERVIEAHLETHTTLEWVTEVMRLRNAAAGTVAVGREDLERVHDYARRFDVDEDPAMIRVAAVLRG